MYLKTTVVSTDGATVADLGYAIIKSVELQIGGTKIDKHYGHWMSVWSSLTVPAGKLSAHDAIVGSAALGAGVSQVLFVPLHFFCCRNDGLALPLIALQYHDVRLEFEFNTAAKLDAGADISMSGTTLLVDYIYLDSEERKRFAQASHEYLIEQVQHQEETVNTNTVKARLNFNHPIKELIWASKLSSATGVALADTTNNAILKLNGHDRFRQQDGLYFNSVQPWQHHTRTPRAGINVYSFALNPEEHQPSGTCNFSRIDNAELTVNTVAGSGTANVVDVYAVNYNVLRIMSGMGGLAYSN